ncbi:MAG: DUF4349 domain-containing protein [Saprospiraceae bacterium]|nr:DUF4349 domain-containing protein [Saprospiraceae bacterium]
MKAPFLIIFVFLLLALISCNSSPNETMGSVASEESAAPPASVQSGKMAEMDMAEDGAAVRDESTVVNNPNPSTPGPKKIIKDGHMTVKSANIVESKKALDEVLKGLKAYYETEELQNNDHQTSFNLRIRIPSENFEQLISAIESGGDEIMHKSVQTRDVTEQYTDIETRLANKRGYLKRYKELLGKANTIKDILSIEEQIRPLEEEIESQEGRLRYLSDQVAFSTLNMTLYTEKEYI